MKALLALGMTLALAGCLEKPDGSADTQKNFEVACAGADLGFVLYKSFEERVKPSVALKVEASYASAKLICMSPPTNNTEALIAILRAAANFNKALAEAKAAAE